MSKLEVNKEEVVNIYNNSTPQQKEVLKKVFGEFFDVRDRVKTFEDACNELGKDHLFFKEYVLCQENGCSNDLIAYLKLRIITAALNEGWEPKFTKSEHRYYPYFVFTEEKTEDSLHVVNVFYSYYHNKDFPAYGYILCFKSMELAVYAGKQFIELYSEFNGLWKLR